MDGLTRRRLDGKQHNRAEMIVTDEMNENQIERISIDVERGDYTVYVKKGVLYVSDEPGRRVLMLADPGVQDYKGLTSSVFHGRIERVVVGHRLSDEFITDEDDEAFDAARR